MSRIGQKIIEIPDNVEANLGQDEIKLSGPKGELSAPIFEGASIEIADKTITATVKAVCRVCKFEDLNPRLLFER